MLVFWDLTRLHDRARKAEIREEVTRYKKEFLHIFSICWYTPAEQPPSKLAEANKIVANSDKTEIKMSRKYSRSSGSWLKVLPIKNSF